MFFRNIILIKPAKNFNLSILRLNIKIIFWNYIYHFINDATFTEQVVWQKKLGIIRNLLKQPRQNCRQCVALGDQQVFIEFIGLVFFLQGIDLLHVQSIQLQMNRFGDNLGLKVILLIRKYAHTGREVSIDLHIAQSTETVEPGIGGFFHDLLIAVLLDFGNQCLPLLLLCSGQEMPIYGISICIADILF